MILTIAWALAILFVYPAGNFPINDDWSYADAVRRLVELGEWRLNGWTSMPLGTQIAWGWLFSQPAGFSFTALRVSTLVLAWSATMGLHALLRLAGAAPAVALCGALALAACPVFFPLAFTFMTDVPACALGIWALVCALAHLQDGRAWQLAGTLALLTATTLVRHTGLALGIGAMAALLAAPGMRRRHLAAAACVLVPATALFVWTMLVQAGEGPNVHHVRETQLLHAASNPRLLLSNLMHSAAGTYLCLGLFLLPVAPLLAATVRVQSSRIAAGAIVVVFAAYQRAYGVQLPSFGNILHDVGLNPVLVARADLWPHAPGAVWIAATAAAAVTAALAFGGALPRVAAAWRDSRRAAAVLFGVSCIAYLGPLLAAGHLFDRYLALPLVLMMALLVSVGALTSPSRAAIRATVVLLTAMGLFDVAATRDFFAFSRARWAAVHDAVELSADADALDGGFEVTGWLTNRTSASPEARFVIALGDIDGHARVSAHEFPRWLGASPGVVYLLQRSTEP